MRDRGFRWVALCTAFSLFMGLTAVLTPSYALAEPAALDSQEELDGGVIDAPGNEADGIKWTFSKDGVLRISSEDQDRSINFMIDREEFPWYPYCPQVKKVVVGPGITSLGTNVFEGYTGLESVEFCEGIVDIFNGCFQNCISLTEVTLPDSLQEISGVAFADCTSLERIDLPDQVSEIGSGVFENCTSLTTVNFPKQLKKIGDRVFAGCDHLKTVCFPETLVRMGENTFDGCKALETFRVPDGFTILPHATFYGCEKLREIIFPETLAKIESSVFEGAKELTSVHFPASMKEIGENSFAGCGKLSTLYFDGNAPILINESAFLDVEATAFYPSDDATWTEEKMQNYGGKIQWVPWDPETGETGAILISDDDVTLSSDQIPCSYEVHCPEVNVVCGGKKLVQGKDYTLSIFRYGYEGEMTFEDNAMYSPGSFQVQIIGQGGYCGIVKKGYEIVEAEPELQFASSYVEKQTDSSSFINQLTMPDGVQCSYTSSDPAIASVDSYGYVTIHAAGVVDITVNSKEDGFYKAGSASYRLNISEPPVITPKPTVTPTESPTPSKTILPVITPKPTVSPTKTPVPSKTVLPVITPKPTAFPTKDPTPTNTILPVVTPKPAEKTSDNLIQATTSPAGSDSPSTPSPGKSDTAASRQKENKLPKPRIVLKKGKSKTGMRYIRIKIKRCKGKYVQIYLRQKNKKYKRIKLASSVLKGKKSFKLAYTHRNVTLWFKVRTYAKRGKKRIYSPFSKAKRVVL